MFASYSEATDTLRSRLQDLGADPQNLDPAIERVMTEARGAFMAGVNPALFKDALYTYVKRVPTSNPSVYHAVFLWVQDVLSPSLVKSVPYEPPNIESNELPPPPPPETPAPVPVQMAPVTRVESSFDSFDQAVAVLESRFRGAGIPIWPKGVDGFLQEARFALQPGVNADQAQESLFSRIKRDVPTTPPMLPFLLVQWVNQLLGFAGYSGMTGVDTEVSDVGTPKDANIAMLLVEQLDEHVAALPPMPPPVRTLQPVYDDPPPPPPTPQPEPSAVTTKTPAMSAETSNELPPLSTHDIVDSVSDVAESAVDVVSDAIEPPPGDEPVLFGLTAKQLGVVGVGLGLLFWMRK